MSGSKIRHSTPGTMIPAVARMSAFSSSGRCWKSAFTRETDAIGVVSVMPHAWSRGRPVASRNPSDSVFGTAEPPHGMARNDDTSRPFSSGITPIQMVGTPAATVTFSFSMRSTNAGGERSGPGMTKFAPA